MFKRNEPEVTVGWDLAGVCVQLFEGELQFLIMQVVYSRIVVFFFFLPCLTRCSFYYILYCSLYYPEVKLV